MPSMELFDQQSKLYKNKILNETKFKISIEAGSSDCWKKYLGSSGLTFGIMNGIALYGNLIPYGGTFLIFSILGS